MTDGIMTQLVLTMIVLGGFLFDWIAIIFRWEKVKPYAKGLATTLILVWTALGGHLLGEQLIAVLLIAQFFGLLGDIFLLFTGNWFVFGLAAFLAGHIFYLGLLSKLLDNAVNNGLITCIPWMAIIIGLVIWSIYLLFFHKLYSPHIAHKEKSEKPFWFAVLLYGAMLSFFVVYAAICAIIIPDISWARLSLPVGATLFFVSDNILAYDRFIRKLPNGKIWVMVTYHLGQFGLAIGFLNLIGFLAANSM